MKIPAIVGRYGTDATRTEIIETHVQASTHTKIHSRSVELPIHRSEQDGPRALACPYRPVMQPFSTSLNDHIQKAIAWMKDPSRQPPIPSPTLLTGVPLEPIRLSTLQPLDVRENDMLLHPVHRLYLAIMQNIPAPQPRGKAKPRELPRGPRMIEILPPEQYYNKDYLIHTYQACPLPCIQLSRRRYLYLGPPTYLNALKAIGIAMIPFSLLPRPRRMAPTELYDKTVALTARLAFESLEKEPLYRRPEVRAELYLLLCQLGLDSYFFGPFSEEHIQKHLLQLASSTVRRKQQQASSRRPFHGAPR